MPTTNPRVNVTLSPSQYRLLRSLSARRGVPMSRILLELFEATEPVLRRVDKVLGAAQAAKNSYAEGLKRNADEAGAEIERLHQLAMQQFDQFAEVIEAGQEGGVRSRRDT